MIEIKFQFNSLSEALELLKTAAGQTGTSVEVVTPTPAPVAQPAPVAAPAPVVEAPAPVAQPAPAPVAEMPAPPTFVTPAPVEQAGAPFSDSKGMIAYVMDSYKALGAQKGQGIQNVLAALSYSNINDVKPEDYGKLYQGIENLKKG